LQYNLKQQLIERRDIGNGPCRDLRVSNDRSRQWGAIHDQGKSHLGIKGGKEKIDITEKKKPVNHLHLRPRGGGHDVPGRVERGTRSLGGGRGITWQACREKPSCIDQSPGLGKLDSLGGY